MEEYITLDKDQYEFFYRKVNDFMQAHNRGGLLTNPELGKQKIPNFYIGNLLFVKRLQGITYIT